MIVLVVFLSWVYLLSLQPSEGWIHSGWRGQRWDQHQPVLTQIANTFRFTSIKHRSNTFVLDRCLIDLILKVFALWVSTSWDATAPTHPSGSTLIKHRSDTFVSDRCLINVDSEVFTDWMGKAKRHHLFSWEYFKGYHMNYGLISPGPHMTNTRNTHPIACILGDMWCSFCQF